MPDFDPASPIAVTIDRFTLLKKADRRRYSEPYIVSIAMDQHGFKDALQVQLSSKPFPKVARGETINLRGVGHLVYGPANPGEFLSVSILVMESDQGLRNVGQRVREAVTKVGKALVAAGNPGAGFTGNLVNAFVDEVLTHNKDDELLRAAGSFLQGTPIPYNVGDRYTDENQYVSIEWDVTPLATISPLDERPELISLGSSSED